MLDIAAELKKIRLSSGLSQQKFADLIGIAQRTWSSYESGQTSPKMDVLLLLAEKGYTIKGVTSNFMDEWPEEKKLELQRRLTISKEAGLSPNMPIDDVARIINAVDNHPKPLAKSSFKIYQQDDLPKGSFVVPLLNQKLSAGNGVSLPESDEETALVPIPAQLSKYGKNLAALTVDGDSMYPTLDRGDMVVCDSCGWSGEGIYALRMGGDGFVKRLTKAPGKLVIISDNPKYPVREEPEDSQDFEIIGRVHCAIKNME